MDGNDESFFITPVKKRKASPPNPPIPIPRIEVDKLKSSLPIKEKSIEKPVNKEVQKPTALVIPPGKKRDSDSRCRCEELSSIQQRFCDQFKNIRKRKIDNGTKSVETYLVNRKTKKLNRLERLADDLKRSLKTVPTDVKIRTKGSLIVSAHNYILKARTKLKITPEMVVDLTDYSFEAIDYYITYIYTTSMDWTRTVQGEIRTLAEEYGPVELAAYFTEAGDEVETENEMDEQVNEEDTLTDKEKTPELCNNVNNEGPMVVDERNEASEHNIANENVSNQNQTNSDNRIEENMDNEPVLNRESTVTRDNDEVVSEGNIGEIFAQYIVKEPEISPEKNQSNNSNNDAFNPNKTIIILSDDDDDDVPQPNIPQISPIVNRRSTNDRSPSIEFISVITKNSERNTVTTNLFANTSVSSEESMSKGDGRNSPLASISTGIRTINSNTQCSVMMRRNSGHAIDQARTSPLSPVYSEFDQFSPLPPQSPINNVRPEAEMNSAVELNPVTSPVKSKSTQLTTASTSSSVQVERVVSPPYICCSLSPKPLKKRSAAIEPAIPEDSFYQDISFSCFNPNDNFVSSTPLNRIIPKNLDQLSDRTKREKIAKRLGSGVKILKTKDITPMPSFETWTDEKIKAECKANGLRADKARKTLINELKKIYMARHPEVDLNSATPKRNPPALSTFTVPLVNFNENENDSSDGNSSQRSLLNDSTEEVMEESCVFDDDEPIKKSPTKGRKLISDVPAAKRVFLAWLKLAQNEELYNSVLSMQPVNWNDLINLMACSDHDVKRITKKILPDVLDSLHITFSFPDKVWKRGKGFKSG